MYLKSIKALGFKSFADKTNIEFNDGITAIVGPNGSGKSNIVDAVRWVLGEQSVKSLRGTGSMSDVIFMGSKTRDTQNRASVTLVFDNSDHHLKTDFTEVEVKRVVYASGENEYYINNSKVRLKDITELFLDTGIGNDSLNIISQKKIEEIVDAKPIDRRVVFESAAGVAKYRKRKEESLRKLDKTKDNLDKLNLVISELEATVIPLKDEAEKAVKYNDFKSELKGVEISLVAYDITALNEKSIKLKQEIENLEKEATEITNSNKEDLASIELKKLEIIKLEEQITNKNKEILELTSKVSQLQSQKQIALEREKFKLSKEDIKSNILNLKEEKLNLEKDIEINKKQLEKSNDELSNIKKNLDEKNELEIKLKTKRTSLNNKLNEVTSNLYRVKSRKEILQDSIENNDKLPASIKNILSNPRLKGVHNIVSKLINTDDRYIDSLDVSLSSGSNFLVVDSEADAKKCINYLKENHLGRATFFPINVIKERNVDFESKNKIQNVDGYIGTMDELVKYDSIYTNIVKNLLGNIICVNNIDTATKIGKLTSYKYRIVTLDGDIIHAGGSLSGGSKKQTNSIINDKKELERLKNEEKENKELLDDIMLQLKDIDDKISNVTTDIEDLTRKYITQKESADVKENTINTLEESLKNINEQISGNKDLEKNKIDEVVDKILNEVKELTSKLEIENIEVKDLNNKKHDLNEEVITLENTYHKIASSYNKIQNDIKEREVDLGKIDIRLDNLLITLTENYSITYEKAKSDYPLEINEDTARDKVSYLKKEIIKLGDVNIGAKAEYDRLNTRYEFLKTQKEDLEKASNELLEVINEMDEIMKDKFKETFLKIQDEFTKVFKTMFRGGEGSLYLTDPDDLLNSGVEIKATPPGKKLKSNSFLSGGEKTLTSIALLFSILNVNPVPFCILDEVEAALDEANVELFGKYLKENKNKSQFILITHKKKTMEYADTLYGITMQESGVSKIVSVKLEDN